MLSLLRTTKLTGLFQQRGEEDGKTWGAAYHIPFEKVQEVREYLDAREINGYSVQYTPFHPADAQIPQFQCLVYIGMPENPQFLGAIKPQDVAEIINNSIGPSGSNRDYLLQLDAGLHELAAGCVDIHVRDLARRIQEMAPAQLG